MSSGPLLHGTLTRRRYISPVVKRTIAVLAVALMVGLAGCGAISPGDSGTSTATPTEQVSVENDAPAATNVNQTLRMTVGDDLAGSEWTVIGAEYPRENFTVNAAQHGEIVLGVDTDGDGDLEQSFNESHVSGVNNNAYSFDVTLETGYTLEEGDVVVVGYPAIDNPEQPGDYEVELRLNDQRTTNATVTIG